MKIELIETNLQGLYICKSNAFIDSRGSFFKVFSKQIGACIPKFGEIVDVNLARNFIAGTTRGMHYQIEEFAETKIVSCLIGSIFDVVVDVRQGSITQFEHFSIKLDDTSNTSLIIPPGFAHGYQTLKDNTLVHYSVNNNYNPHKQRGLSPLDPSLNIDWPLEITQISDQDKSWPQNSEIGK